MAVLVVVACGVVADGIASPASRPRPTGQFDQATVVRGQLREALLAAAKGSASATAPDPRHPITLRASLRPTAGQPRVLMLTFRSRAGARCVGITVHLPGLHTEPTRCLPPCHRALCGQVVLGGPFPRGVFVLTALASTKVDEIAVVYQAGRSTRYRVSNRRIGSPPFKPILARVGRVRTVIALVAGERVDEIRFPKLPQG
jgi:hypothetical protein